MIIDNLAGSSLWRYHAGLIPPKRIPVVYPRGKLVDFFLVIISLPEGWYSSPACPEAGINTDLECGVAPF